jgi:hypothetical protein
MPGSATPQVNESNVPYQFDGQVTIGGANASTSMSPLAAGDLAYKAWNFPTYLATGTSTFSITGSVYLSAVHLSAALTYSNIYVGVIANGGTASAGSCFAGVYNAAGTLVATTADLSGVLSTVAGNTGLLTFPLATALTPASGGQFWVGMFFNASGTASMPVLAGLAGQTAANALTTYAGTVGKIGGIAAAAPAVAAPFPFAAVATTSGTAMPATFALGSAGTTGAQCFWTALA